MSNVGNDGKGQALAQTQKDIRVVCKFCNEYLRGDPAFHVRSRHFSKEFQANEWDYLEVLH